MRRLLERLEEKYQKEEEERRNSIAVLQIKYYL